VKQTIDPVPFHNKIFFCDIIGYSKLPPSTQYERHAQLTRIIRTCLDKLNVRLLDDVIALPTGDGLILNYMKPEPDIHLKTAILVLGMLSKYNKNNSLPIELRIGINTNVDSIVLDVNNKKNIVGVGINLAQRITNISTHGRILLHRRVSEDLSNYKKYEGKFKDLGNFTVKHNVVLPLFQYIDHKFIFLDNTPLQSENKKTSALTLGDIRKRRLKENILSINLKGCDEDYFDDLHDYLEEFLDKKDIFQNTKIAVNWISNELLDNIFRHGKVNHDDDIFLKLDRVRNGINISTEQPDIPEFSVREIDNSPPDHFLPMLRKRGINVSILHTNGRMMVSCFLPFEFEIKRIKMLDIAPDVKNKQKISSTIDWSQKKMKSFSATISYTVLGKGVCLIKVRDKMYLNEARIFKELMRRFVEIKKIDFIVDLSELIYICSTGIANLLNYHRIVRMKGGTIIYANPHEKLNEVFSICKLDQMLQITKSMDDALTYFKMFH